jgi:hypothetical protein
VAPLRWFPTGLDVDVRHQVDQEVLELIAVGQNSGVVIGDNVKGRAHLD